MNNSPYQHTTRPKLHRRARSGGSVDFLHNVPYTDDDDDALSRTRKRFKEWVGYIISFFKNHWHLVTFVSVSGFIVVYQLYKRRRQAPSLSDSVRNSLRLPNNSSDLDPRWKIYPSRITSSLPRDTKSSQLLPAPFSVLRTRSMTRIGREAAIQRYGTTVDNIKGALSLVTYRIPRAIQDWESWLTSAAYGLFYFTTSGNTPFSPQDPYRISFRSTVRSWLKEKRENGRERRKKLGTKLKQLIKRPFAEERIVDDLKNAYDKKMM